jgi:hypothetical protein
VYQRAFADFSSRDIELLNGLLVRVMRNLSLAP